MKLVQRMQWLPFVIYLYPVVAGFLVDSTTHDILGKYSVSWFAFCLLNLTLYPAFFWFHKNASLVGKSAVLGAMSLMTVLAVNNMQMVLSPFMVDTWSLTRGAAGLSLLTICFSLFQLQKYRNTFIVFAVASLLIGSSAADIIMGPGPKPVFPDQIANPDPECENGFSNKFLALNDEYLALHPFATGDILIIGDSITRGLGIHEGCTKAYPKALRRLEDTKATPPRTIHIMTIGGARIPQHIALLNLLPETVKFDRIILQFRYELTPLEPMSNPTSWDKLRRRTNDFVFMLHYGGFSLRMLAITLTPYFNDTDEFTNKYPHELHDLEAGSPTFAAKLESLRQPLLQLNSLATRHSKKPPIIMISPMILEFENYALEETNTALINLAHETNFVPLDLLPIYRAVYKGKGWNVADIWHPDAEAHASVAQYLAQLLD